MLPAPVQLMKLQLHRQLPLTARASLDEVESGLAGAAGEVCPQLLWNQYGKP